MIKAVLWDVDDTLFDYSGADRTAVRRHLEAEGLPYDEAAFRRWREVMRHQYRRFEAGELTFEQQRRERVRAYLDRDVSDAEVDAWFARYIALFEAAWTAFPDVAAVLEALPYRHGVLSNSSTDLQERKLTALRLRHRFEIVMCCDAIGCAKPDPAAFLAACTALRLRPDEVAYVGDRLDLDAVGARDAGLHGIWLDRRSRTPGTGGHEDGDGSGEPDGEAAAPVPDPLPGGVHRIVSLTELPALLLTLPDGRATAPTSPRDGPRRGPAGAR